MAASLKSKHCCHCEESPRRNDAAILISKANGIGALNANFRKREMECVLEMATGKQGLRASSDFRLYPGTNDRRGIATIAAHLQWEIFHLYFAPHLVRVFNNYHGLTNIFTHDGLVEEAL